MMKLRVRDGSAQGCIALHAGNKCGSQHQQKQRQKAGSEAEAARQRRLLARLSVGLSSVLSFAAAADGAPRLHARLPAVCTPPRSYQRYAATGDGASWFQVVDCFSDPLGWEQELEPEGGVQPEGCLKYREMSAPLDGLLALVVAAGRPAVRNQPGSRFTVLLDSVSDLLRCQRENLPAVAGFVSSLRSHADVSALVMLVRAGCHDARTASSLAYLASVNAYLEPHPSLAEEALVEAKVLERNMSGGRLRVRQRRQNGRYREEVEEFQVDDTGIRFCGVADKNRLGVGGASGIAEVKFNLQLTAKELEDRAKVVLPFEHQGQGKQVQIYDGRADASALGLKDLSMSKGAIASSDGGEIHYLRDSDDEVPDSNEDPATKCTAAVPIV